jgi:predicted transport protein
MYRGGKKWTKKIKEIWERENPEQAKGRNMAIFKLNKNKVKKLLAASPKLERDIQKLFQNNLEELLNISFLASEFVTTWGGRIDTLGIDKNSSPVIIEYKLNQNENVINQALSYLRWLLDHKADFEKLCNGKNINFPIDWESPRVICVAENFNKFDIDTVSILPIRIELLRYTIYEEGILQIELENYQQTPGIKKTKKEKIEIIEKKYSLESHIEKSTGKIKEIFYSLREKIMSLDKNIVEEPKAKYIAYKLSTNFVDITVQADSLKIFLNLKSGQLDDKWGITRDLTKPKPVGHWGNGDYEIKLSSAADIDKVFELVKQSYNYNR